MPVLYLLVLFEIWISVVAGQTPSSNWTSPNASSSSSPACTGCAIAAEEFYLSYPFSVLSVTQSVIVTVIPYITVHDDGTRETNLLSETQGLNRPTSINGPLGGQQPKLTWEPYAGVTLTYPTTYVNFPSPYGGLNYSSNGACVTATTPLTLPTNSEQGLIYPVTISDWDTRQPWNVTQQMLDYLDSIPAVSQQFHGTKVGSCEWATYVTPVTQPAALPIQKVTVQYLTARTAQAVIVTPGTRDPAPSSTAATPPTALTRNVPAATSTGQPTPSRSTSTTPHTIAVSTSVITRSALTTLIALPDGAISTMTVVPAYSITSLIYSMMTEGGAGLNSTQFASTSTPAIYTGKANRIRPGFLGWIIGVICAAML